MSSLFYFSTNNTEAHPILLGILKVPSIYKTTTLKDPLEYSHFYEKLGMILYFHKNLWKIKVLVRQQKSN